MFTSLVFVSTYSTYILYYIRIIRDILIQYQWYQKTSSARIKSQRAPLHLLEGTASTPVFACRQPQASAFGNALPIFTIKNIQKKHPFNWFQCLPDSFWIVLKYVASINSKPAFSGWHGPQRPDFNRPTLLESENKTGGLHVHSACGWVDQCCVCTWRAVRIWSCACSSAYCTVTGLCQVLQLVALEAPASLLLQLLGKCESEQNRVRTCCLRFNQ